ncbi:unnamed protein product [Alternaria alternata]
MAVMDTTDLVAKALNASIATLVILLTATLGRIFYMQKLHPLSKFPGPWYASSFSVFGAIVSVLHKEPQFFMYLVEKYGTDSPIRISPTMLLFPKPSALKDIYRDPQCNTRGGMYDSGALGPPHLVSTIDGEKHRVLRKALSNAPWSIGPLKNAWEPRFDEQVSLLIKKLKEHAEAKRTICLSDKVAEFAADILSIISFTQPFGSVENQRDEKYLLTNWRKGLTFFGFSGRCRFFRERILRLPVRTVKLPGGEQQNKEKPFEGRPDFLQHCLDARYSDGSPLTPTQKRAHVTLLYQAGADTTGTALGCILRLILTNPSTLARVRTELDAAESSGLLSTPIRYDETLQHLPFFVACIKEGLRLFPPAPNLFPRVIPKEGKVIDGHYVPGGMDVTSHAYTVQRDKDFYGQDAEDFKPDMWLQSEKRNFELEAAQFTFGIGSRICLGKDVAKLEMYKLLPEIIRRFDIQVKNSGSYVVDGGVAYNVDFLVELTARNSV